MEISNLKQRLDRLEHQLNGSGAYYDGNNPLTTQVKDNTFKIYTLDCQTTELEKRINGLYKVQQDYKELFSPEIINKIDSKMDNKSDTLSNIQLDTVINLLTHQKHELAQLSEDYYLSKQYLDNIDDTLDQFEDTLLNLAQENEIMLSGLIKLKAEFDMKVVQSIKENVILTSSLSVMLHELISGGYINGLTYITNFTRIIEDIANAYKRNEVDIDFSKDIEILKGNITPEGIVINLPYIGEDSCQVNVSVPTDKDKKIITITEAKRIRADQNKLKIKNENKPKEIEKSNKLEDKKPNNVIDNIFERIKELRDKKGKKDE